MEENLIYKIGSLFPLITSLIARKCDWPHWPGSSSSLSHHSLFVFLKPFPGKRKKTSIITERSNELHLVHTEKNMLCIEGLDLSLCLFFSEWQGIANKGDERDVTKCHMLIIGQKLDICLYFCSSTSPCILQVLSQKYGASSFGKKESQNENDPLQHACLPLLPWKPPTLLIPCLGYWHYQWLSLELEGYPWSPQLDSHTFSSSHLSHLPLTSLYLSISLQLGPIAQRIGNL